jgi:hypothetical protein
MKKIILLSLISLMFSGTAFAAGTDEPTTLTEVTISGDADAGDAADEGDAAADELGVDPSAVPRKRPRIGGFIVVID